MNHRKAKLLALLLFVALMAAACAGPAVQPPAEEATAPAPTEAPVTVAERVFIYAHPTTFPDLDPSPGFSNENVVNVLVYETLVRYNPPGSDQLLSPVLATAWKANADSTQWTFQLRQGVKFHDGTDFNAEAVKFSIERTMELGQGAAFIWDPVESIEVIDDYTVRFVLKYPAPLDLIASSGYGAWIMSPATVKGKDSAWFNAGHDAGTGPYTIQSYERGQRMILSRFADYWGGWQPNQFDKVILQVVEDPVVRQQMIESGQADFTYEIPIDNLAALDANPDVRVVSNPAFQNLLALLNTRKPPLDNPKVRQALAYSFPYEVVVDSVMQGYAVQSHGPVPEGLFGHDPELPQYEHNLDKARDLLAEAGFPDGKGFPTLNYTFATGDLVEQQAGELWRAELAKLGIDMTLQGMAWEAQWDLAKADPENAQDIFVFYWWPTYPTPYDFLFSMFHSEDQPFFNLSYYNNPGFDQAIDEANQLIGTHPEKAEGMFGHAQEMLVDDAPAIFIFDQENIHVIRAGIQGYVDNPAYPHVVFVYELSR